MGRNEYYSLIGALAWGGLATGYALALSCFTFLLKTDSNSRNPDRTSPPQEMVSTLNRDLTTNNYILIDGVRYYSVVENRPIAPSKTNVLEFKLESP